MDRGPNLLRVLMVTCVLAIGCSGDPDSGDPFDPIDNEPSAEPGVDPVTGSLWPGIGSDGGTLPGEEPPPGQEPPPPGQEPPPPGEEPPPPGEEPPPPGEEPPPPATGELGISSLGALPSELSGLRWAERPRITREVTVTTASALNTEAAVAGTRIRVQGAVGGDLSLGANDVEIIADAATSLGQVSIGRSVSRVRIEGGRWTGFSTPLPTQYYPTSEFHPEWMAQDVSIEGVAVNAADTAFSIRGRRIVIARSRGTAGRYTVWCGDTGSSQTEDLILYDNVFSSAGPESTVRLVSVLRTATVSNVIVNTNKHNYRIHGVSDLAFASDNLLINSGVMLGRMAGDSLNRIWFDDNVMHQTQADLFNPDAAIQALRARRNTVYDNGHTSFMYGGAQPGWDVSENTVAPYTAPPAY